MAAVWLTSSSSWTRQRDLAELRAFEVTAAGADDDLQFAEPAAGGGEGDVDVVVEILRARPPPAGAAAVLGIQDADDAVGAGSQQQRLVQGVFEAEQPLGGARAEGRDVGRGCQVDVGQEPAAAHAPGS